MAALTKFTMDDIYAITGGLNINPGIPNGPSFRVYLGKIKRGNPWKLPKQTVVVKAPVDNNPRSIQAFERELAALTSLQHKYIVKLIGYRNEGDQRYLVVEYLANGTLLDKIDESLTWPHVRRMLKGVARGIEYIHGMNLVHTDICPANILIDKRYKVKLNGLGCVVGENQDAVAEYRDGFRPEQTHAGDKLTYKLSTVQY